MKTLKKLPEAFEMVRDIAAYKLRGFDEAAKRVLGEQEIESVEDMGMIGGGGAGADIFVSTKTRPTRKKKKAAQIKANKIKPGGNQGKLKNQ